MIYLFDNSIVDDLKSSFNLLNVTNPVVKVIDPEQIIDLAAQIKEGNITFPVVALTRNPDTPIDTARTNFTRMHKGVATVLDKETNELYYERAIPIELSYKLTLLATNTADMDELVKEMLFKYTNMYFLTLTLPYECERKIRFGIIIDKDSDIERTSGSTDYIQSGQLHQTIIPLVCEGAVLVSYTPAKLVRTQHDIGLTLNINDQES